MRLSIIIALYNTETYIERCIRSIYEGNSLSFESYEVIVINDGSTDNSPDIVQKLQKEYRNITLINKKNGGQSTARNIGFDLAKGNYIFCLDSDDFIDAPKLIEALEYSEQENLDMLPIFIKKFDENYEPLPQSKDNFNQFEQVISGGHFMCKFVISGSMCRYFYKTGVIREHKLRLTEGVFHEDEEFVIKFMSYCNRIAYFGSEVYQQVVRADSTTNNKGNKHRKKLLRDLLVIIEKLKLHRNILSKNSLEYKGVSKKIEQLTVSIFLRMKNDQFNYNEIEEFVNRLQDLELYPIRINHLNIKFKAAALFFNCSLFNKHYYK